MPVNIHFLTYKSYLSVDFVGMFWVRKGTWIIHSLPYAVYKICRKILTFSKTWYVSFRSGCTINIIYGLSKQALEALYSIVAQKSVIARMKKISQSRFFSWWSENKVTYVINSPSAWQTPTLFSKVRRNSDLKFAVFLSMRIRKLFCKVLLWSFAWETYYCQTGIWNYWGINLSLESGIVRWTLDIFPGLNLLNQTWQKCQVRTQVATCRSCCL